MNESIDLTGLPSDSEEDSDRPDGQPRPAKRRLLLPDRTSSKSTAEKSQQNVHPPPSAAQSEDYGLDAMDDETAAGVLQGMGLADATTAMTTTVTNNNGKALRERKRVEEAERVRLENEQSTKAALERMEQAALAEAAEREAAGHSVEDEEDEGGLEPDGLDGEATDEGEVDEDQEDDEV